MGTHELQRGLREAEEVNP